MVSETQEVVTDAELERRTRRRFSSGDRQRLLAEHDAVARGCAARVGTPGSWRIGARRWPSRAARAGS